MAERPETHAEEAEPTGETGRKAFLLRLSPELHAELRAWAARGVPNARRSLAVAGFEDARRGWGTPDCGDRARVCVRPMVALYARGG